MKRTVLRTFEDVRGRTIYAGHKQKDKEQKWQRGYRWEGRMKARTVRHSRNEIKEGIQEETDRLCQMQLRDQLRVER